MKKTSYYILIIIIVLFTSCEYSPSGSNFVELTKPADSIAIGISLNDINPADTIYIYQDTRISVKLFADSKDLRQATVFLDSQQYYLWNSSDNFDFVIRPYEVEEGVHKLTVNAVFASGSGSLAEIMGMEGYMGEMSWNIRVIPNPESHFQVGYRINKDGFLEIYWDNAVPENVIEKYTVRVPFADKDSIINNPKQKSFIDYGYVCGYAYYQVSTYLKSGYSYMTSLSLDKPTPAIYFEDLGIDRLRVYWDKPFANGRFNLSENDVTLSSGMIDTTITIPQIFGRNRQFSLEIRPQKAEYDNTYSQYSAWGSFYQGVNLGLQNWALFAYNKKDNIIYSTRYNDLVAFDANTLIEKNHISIIGNPWGLMYGGRVACAPNNSTVAAMTGEETWIFADNRFTNPIIIPNLPGNVNTRLSALTSDDRFFVVLFSISSLPTSGNCQVFNTKTGKKIFDFSFTHAITSIDSPNCVTVSDDGRYFFAASVNGMELFEINGTTVNLLYADTRRYTTATFVPNKPDKLLVRANSDIELRQIPNFDLIQKLDVSPTGAILCNVDPATGYLLYYQDGFLKVAPADNLANLIFNIRSEGTLIEISHLLNNKLLTYGGIALDISPYIKP